VHESSIIDRIVDMRDGRVVSPEIRS
jgi:hypothetical protein